MMKRLMRIVIAMLCCVELFAHVGFAAEMKKILILSTVRSRPVAAQSGATRLEGLGFIDQKMS